MNKIEKAISIIQFTLRKRKEKLERMSRRMQPTEAEKIYIGEETELIKNIELLVDEYKKNFESALGKIPPQDVELERTILGAIILESAAIDKVKSFLTPDHFYLEQNKLLYAAILSMHKEMAPIDMRTIVVKLRREGRLEQVGGAHYIASVTSTVSSAANLEYHGRILVEFAIRREMIVLGGDVVYLGYDETTDALELLERTQTRIKEIGSWVKK